MHGNDTKSEQSKPENEEVLQKAMMTWDGRSQMALRYANKVNQKRVETKEKK